MHYWMHGNHWFISNYIPLQNLQKVESLAGGSDLILLALVPYLDWSLEAPTTANRGEDRKTFCMALICSTDIMMIGWIRSLSDVTVGQPY
jgi:hypothetical protein